VTKVLSYSVVGKCGQAKLGSVESSSCFSHPCRLYGIMGIILSLDLSSE
jgi:hypothetical protein